MQPRVSPRPNDFHIIQLKIRRFIFYHDHENARIRCFNNSMFYLFISSVTCDHSDGHSRHNISRAYSVGCVQTTKVRISNHHLFTQNFDGPLISGGKYV